MTFPMVMFMPSSANAEITSISQQASGSSTDSATVTWPSVTAGDLAILFDIARGPGGSSLPTSVTPTGFTNILDAAVSASFRSMISTKVCVGSETGSITGMTPTSDGKKCILIMRGDVPLASVAGGSPVSAWSGLSNPSSISITASGGTAPLLALAVYHSTGAIDPRTFTVSGSPAKDDEISFLSSDVYFAWKFYAASPANVTADMDDEGSNNGVFGAYIQLTT